MADLKVFVCVFVDDFITLTVSPSTTIHQLMAKIREFPSGFDGYLLLFHGCNLLDSTSSTIQQCGINDEDHLILSRKGLFTVRVHNALMEEGAKETALFQVETLEKVKDLKKKIMGEMDVPVKIQHLYYCSHFMDDDTTLASHGIFNPWDAERLPSEAQEFGYLIELLTLPYSHPVLPYPCPVFSDDASSSSDCTIAVEVPTARENIRLNLTIKANLKDTIDTLKAKILDKVCIYKFDRALDSVSVDLYALLFNRTVLESGSLTLDECNIKHKDRIVLCTKTDFTVVVQLVLVDAPNQLRVHPVCVRCSDSVAMLKDKIMECAGISPEEKLLLRYKGKCLKDDGSCLVEHGILEFPRTAGYLTYQLCDTDTHIVEAIGYRA